MTFSSSSLLLGFAILINSFVAEAAPFSESRRPVDGVYFVQTQVKDLPKSFSKYDARLEKADPEALYTVTIGMLNDNLVVLSRDSDGDDRGLAHGHFLRVDRLTANGVMLTVSIGQDIYAQDFKKVIAGKDGRKYRTQRTETETILRFLVSNAPAGKTFFYTLGAGWQRLDPSGDTFIAKTQITWHDLNKNLQKIENVPGEINEAGFFGEIHGGVQRNGNWGPFKTHGSFSVGVTQSEIEGASFYSVDVDTWVQYDLESGRATRLLVGVKNRVHEEGLESKVYVGLEIVGKKFNCGFELSKINGDVMNYQGYNLPNREDGEMDLIGKTYCQRKF